MPLHAHRSGIGLAVVAKPQTRTRLPCSRIRQKDGVNATLSRNPFAAENPLIVQRARRFVRESWNHRHLADILNHDPKTHAGTFASISTWILGYPDRGLRISNERDAH